jgi:hypothetical protein
MSRIQVALIGILSLALFGSYAASQAPPVRKGLLSHLEAGQMVQAQQVSDNEFAVFIYEDESEKWQMKDTVKQVGDDYVVLTTLGSDKRVREMILPMHSLASIVVVKKPEKK